MGWGVVEEAEDAPNSTKEIYMAQGGSYGGEYVRKLESEFSSVIVKLDQGTVETGSAVKVFAANLITCMQTRHPQVGKTELSSDHHNITATRANACAHTHAHAQAHTRAHTLTGALSDS